MTTSAGKIARVYEMQEHSYSHPTRQVYLDGILKSNSVGQAAAHESSVHPPMLSHDSPKRVVIFGAGLGASTREVLKHNTVEEVTVVGADRAMVDFAKEHLPEWSDCSYANKNGNKMSCFRDRRVHFVYDQTPTEWIANHNGAPYDVALVDLFDMEEEFVSEIMSTRENAIGQLYNKLSTDGVISVNVAGSPKVVESMTKSGMTPTRKILRTALAQEMKNIGFADTFEYDEYKSGFSETRSYVVAFKDVKTSKNWNTNQAEIEIKLKNRIVRNESSGDVSLEFFDAATMATYSKFSSSLEKKDAKEILTVARGKARQAVEQGFSDLDNGLNNGVNSSCLSGGNGEECKNPAIKVAEEQVASGETWSSTHESVRGS
mmetsp:Transcript_10810/g.22887  ORF Transcript_10810/g.22887 Transcript_10810/m.22887 type:complete len:375 (+) Transcript_10810:1163-2287(+)